MNRVPHGCCESSQVRKDSWRQVAQAAVRTVVNVLLTPLFGYQLGLPTVGKEPTVEAFAAQRTVETLDEGVLPGAARCDGQSVAAAVARPQACLLS